LQVGLGTPFQAGGERYQPALAKGLVAIGDIATGVVAVGPVAVGLVAVGSVATGLVTVGLVPHDWLRSAWTRLAL